MGKKSRHTGVQPELPAVNYVPDSRFVEANFKDPETLDRIRGYSGRLTEKYAKWQKKKAPGLDPTERPARIEVELLLLSTLITNSGYVNFTDLRMDLFGEFGQIGPNFEEAGERFIEKTGLAIQQVGSLATENAAA